MRASGSNLLVLNPNENETLARMARDGSVIVEDMEEGEISDDSTSSLTEISAEDFRQESRVSKPKLESRVWIPTNYYNFAWAQAVQNKPLPEIVVRNNGSEEKSSRSDNNKGLNAETKIPNVIIDDSSEEIDSQNEKEEGELEEGEIELLEREKLEKSEEEEERITDDCLSLVLKKRVDPILEALNTVTVKDAEKSFNGVCLRLRSSFESLQPIVLENYALVDDLVQQIFAGIKALYYVFSSASSIQKEQNKDLLLRLLDFVKDQENTPFLPEQMKEIDAMLLSVVSFIKVAEEEKETQVHNGGKNWNNSDIVTQNSALGLISSENFILKPLSVKMGGSNGGNIVLGSTKPGLSFASKGRVDFGPLLDLHADHDEGSLPSPTRESPSSFPTQKPVVNHDEGSLPSPTREPFPTQKPVANHDVGSLPSPTRENPPPLLRQKPVVNAGDVLKSHLETTKQRGTEDAMLHPYETDAVQAVSSYQQKFGRTSFLSSNRLPSPTPSEECDDGDGVGDSQGEVSSSSVVGDVRSVNSAVPYQPTFVSTGSPLDGLSGQLLVPSRTVSHLGPGSNPILKASRNSRDPRLRLANFDAGAFDLNQRPLSVDRNAPKNEIVGGMSSIKHKIDEHSALDAYTLKRQRNGLLDSVVSKDVQLVTGTVGCLDDSSTIRLKTGDKDLSTSNMENDIKNPENAEADFNNGGGYEDMEIDSDDNTPGTYSGSRQLPVMSVKIPVAGGQLPVTTNVSLPVTGGQFPVTNVQLPVAGGQLPVTTNMSLPVTGGQFPVTNVQLPDTSGNLRVTSGHLPVTSAPLPVTSRHLPVTRVPLTASSVQLPVTSGHLPVTSCSSMVSLPSLLKDIAGNPTMLLHLLNMEQQRLAAEARQKSADPSTVRPSNSSILLNTVSSGSVVPSRAVQIEQSSAGKLQNSIQAASTISQNESGKVRMKPRDPRRVLLNNTVQKSENLGSEQSRTNGVPSLNIQGSKETLTVRQQGEQADTASLPSQSQEDTASLPSQSSPLPDIAGDFTKTLKNLAEILSGSQGTSSSSTVVAQNISQPLIPIKSDKLEPRIVLPDSNAQQSISGSINEEGAASSSQSQSTWGDFEHYLDKYDDQQKAAIQRERGRRIEEQNKMFAARKLCLVLDLDHTLLNSAKFVEVDPMHDEILRKKEEQDQEKPHRHLFRFSHMGMWTKLRPGIWSFLEKASKLYELHLYTMGNKLYATEMAKVLDPTGALFAGRVISKGDDSEPFDGDERVPKNKDLDGVLGMESAVVIIDDSVRVWPHHKHNLIIVERYTYFPCSRRQFGLPGPSLLEIDHDERPEEGTLASSFAVIERIHQNFFSHQVLSDVDVRNILASEQHKILNGCRIVFSRVFPVGEANPHLHPLWQMAQQFGAICTNQLDDQVTHVVANSLGTDKVNWALSTGRFVVHPGWVEASALLYRRANEQDFAIKL